MDKERNFYRDLKNLLELLEKNHLGLTESYLRKQFYSLDKGDKYFDELLNHLFDKKLIVEIMGGDNHIRINTEGREYLRGLRIEKIQKEQSKILKEQSNFNRILALATSILAFGVIYDIFIEELIYFDNKIFQDISLILLAFFIFIIFIFIIQFLITFRRKP